MRDPKPAIYFAGFLCFLVSFTELSGLFLLLQSAVIICITYRIFLWINLTKKLTFFFKHRKFGTEYFQYFDILDLLYESPYGWGKINGRNGNFTGYSGIY